MKNTTNKKRPLTFMKECEAAMDDIIMSSKHGFPVDSKPELIGEAFWMAMRLRLAIDPESVTAMAAYGFLRYMADRKEAIVSKDQMEVVA